MLVKLINGIFSNACPEKPNVNDIGGPKSMSLASRGPLPSTLKKPQAHPKDQHNLKCTLPSPALINQAIYLAAGGKDIIITTKGIMIYQH